MRARLTGLALLAAGAAFAGCATKPAVYGPITEASPYGYKDRPSADGGQTVLVVVPSQSSPTEARAFWDRRAAELCPSGVGKAIVFRTERKELMMPAGYVYRGTGISSRATMGYEVEGYLYCKGKAPGS